MNLRVAVPALGASIAALLFGTSFLELGPARAGLALAACAFLPGLAVLLLLRVERIGAATAAALALALSPFVLGTLTTLLLYAAFDVPTAARATIFLVGAGLGYEAWRRASESVASSNADGEADDTGDRDSTSRSLGAATVALAVALTALTLWPVAESNRVRASIHGMLHASILYSTVDRGAPPENPFFAGEPLRYYWTFHAGAASAGELADVEPTIVFAAGNAAALLAFLLLLARLGRALFGSRTSGALALLLGYLGLNPLGVWLLRTHAPLATLDQIASGEDPVNWLKALAIGDERLAATFTKFMNVSSFPQSFALLVGVWLLLAWLVRRPSWPIAGLTALAVGACLALSPITGGVAGLTLGLAGAVFLVRRDSRVGGVWACGALLAGLFVAAPIVYVGSGNAGDTSTEPPLRLEDDGARYQAKLQDVGFTLGPILLIALPGVWLAWRRGGDGARLLALSLPPLLVCAVVLAFPVMSEYKMIRMAAPLLGVFAGGAVAALARRGPVLVGLGTAAALALVVPTNALAWNVYRRHAEATLPMHGEGTRIVVDPAAYPLATMYEWIRTETPDDAVIVCNSWGRLGGGHFAGPHHGEEIPILARRPVFTDVFFYMTDYEPDFPARNAMLQRLFSGARLTPDDYRALAMLRRPIFLLLRAGDPGFTKAALGLSQEPRWERVHKTTEAILFRLTR